MKQNVVNQCNFMEQQKQNREPFQRWQLVTIEQLTYSVNLILGFAIATLGFQITLLTNEKFIPIVYQKCAFLISMIFIVVSISLGIYCVVNRLKDFRATKKVARMGKESEEKIQPHRNLTKKLGGRTWILFWWQIGTFGTGVLFLIVGTWMLVSQKLL